MKARKLHDLCLHCLERIVHFTFWNHGGTFNICLILCTAASDMGRARKCILLFFQGKYSCSMLALDKQRNRSKEKNEGDISASICIISERGSNLERDLFF